MPEVKIGFFADVCSSYFLQKILPGAGKWMGLTGQMISGKEAKQIGLVTHFVDFEDFEKMAKEIQNTPFESFSEVEDICARYARPAGIRRFRRVGILSNI